MYHVLCEGIDHRGNPGTGVLLLCEDTHIVDYITHDMFLLFSKFVEVGYVLRVHSDSDDSVQFFDALCFNAYGNVTSRDLERYGTMGYIVGIDDISYQPSAAFMGQICSPSIKLRYGFDALVDSDGVLWLLDVGNDSTVRLSQICRSIAKNSIIHEVRFDNRYIFDDDLDFVHPECFINENLEPGIEKPHVYCSSKWSQLFNPTHVHQRGI